MFSQEQSEFLDKAAKRYIWWMTKEEAMLDPFFVISQVMNLGDINGIPRVLDAGQCNDSYSLAVIALKLKEVFGLDDINELPIIYNIAWYEQKAVIVLLSLLYLGVKNIHLGPTLPAFLSPNVAKVLMENFGIAGIDTVENDMKLFFEK